MAGGPRAPWGDGDEFVDETLAQQTLTTAAELLARNLEARAARLRLNDVDARYILLEIRRQLATVAVDGTFGSAAALSELAFEVFTADELTNRLLDKPPNLFSED